MTIHHVVKQRNFDSVFEPAKGSASAKLTIKLKVELFALDPELADGPGSGQHPVRLVNNLHHAKRGPVKDADKDLIMCRTWLTHEWDEFKTKFKKMIEMSWNNQMILLPGGPRPGAGSHEKDYKQMLASPRAPAHVECALELELTSNGAHAEIEVAHKADKRREFRSEMTRIVDTDVEFETATMKGFRDRKIYQVTAAHEVGHWLREVSKPHFSHVDWEYAKTLPADQRGDSQYGHVLGKRVAMMGWGNLCTEHEAKPWLSRIGQHVSTLAGWSFMHRIHFRQRFP
jgi:hypothetical protein